MTCVICSFVDCVDRGDIGVALCISPAIGDRMTSLIPFVYCRPDMGMRVGCNVAATSYGVVLSEVLKA